MINLLKTLPIALLLAWSTAATGQDDCQPLLVLMDDITMDDFYQAEVIHSSANITAGTTVTFQAEDTILLTDGFQSLDVAQFHGYIADCMSVATEDINEVNHSIKLFPNPTNALTILEYELDKQTVVSASVVNVLGQEVISLIALERQASGKHQISFDAAPLAADVYFFRMNLDDKVIFRKFAVSNK